MPTFETHQTGCPNCGNNITKVAKIEPQMECPFCHQHVAAPEVKKLQLSDAEKMIRFSTTKHDFTEQVVKKLTETAYVPTDIFNTISPDKMQRAYVPMYVFEGDFTTRWTCKVQRETVDVEGKKRTDYMPADGKTSGHFFFMLAAHEGKDIPAEIIQFAESLPYKKEDFVPFDNDIMTGPANHEVYAWEQNAVAADQFKKRGVLTVKRHAEQAARTQLKEERYKSLKTEHSYEFTMEGQRVMVPIWFIYYYYRNKSYYFLMDGKGLNLSQNMPEDREAANKLKYHYLMELALAAGGVILLPLLFYAIGKLLGVSLLGSWITWLLIVGTWGYLGYRIYAFRRHKEKTLHEAKTMRETAAARLLNSAN